VSTRKSKTVLVVDDDQDMQSLVALLLKNRGYRIQIASNGREGLDLMERVKPDLVLLDVNMPVMDGAEFAREMTARVGCRVPVVLMTGADDVRKQATEMGAAGWIEKPFDLAVLTSTVDRLLKSS
jgi:DNA-binding response OmpR family regulator